MSPPWIRHAARMAEALAASGELADPAWRAAMQEVPRHVFVPDQPLEVAYGAEAIVTQTRPAYALGGDRLDLPTSSASAPAVVAVMLDRLALRDGQRVLEIGTGTGYNTALLCHRLGDQHVYSIDIDPDLVEAARGRLADVGYRPIMVAGDGHGGIPQHAPYDAILATCSLTHIPPAWIGQLAPRGRVVAPLLGAYDAPLTVFDKTADDEVTGRFDPARAAFMPLRVDLEHPLATPRVLAPAALAMPHYGTTSLDPARLAGVNDDFALFLHLHIPGMEIGTGENPLLGKTVAVSDLDSIAAAGLTPTTEGTWPVTQRGPRRLWDTIEHATRLWEALGHPGRDRYGITALDRTDRQYVWLDDPDGPYSWPMPL